MLACTSALLGPVIFSPSKQMNIYRCCLGPLRMIDQCIERRFGSCGDGSDLEEVRDRRKIRGRIERAKDPKTVDKGKSKSKEQGEKLFIPSHGMYTDHCNPTAAYNNVSPLDLLGTRLSIVDTFDVANSLKTLLPWVKARVLY